MASEIQYTRRVIDIAHKDIESHFNRANDAASNNRQLIACQHLRDMEAEIGRILLFIGNSKFRNSIQVKASIAPILDLVTQLESIIIEDYQTRRDV